ncbi:MAG: glycoside hydrolase family 3 C-terminal domain-containing protein [Anaerolineae bacterium]|nr:glycoside hydrolase family 3 C-terminal domain-containing protein [Anaerolineae bacterium]
MGEWTRLDTFDRETVARAEALLAQMTLDEKVGQMNQIDPRWTGDIEEQIRKGAVGSILSLHDVQRINALQRVAVQETRLGIPLLVGNDVVHGFRTIYPIPLAAACTWDPALVEDAARMAADEAAACGTDWIFAPMVDICRDPRWGRVAEGAGEDPVLGQAMARAQVRGFQGLGLAGGRRLAACPKHYVAYGATEAGKDYNTVDISERTLRDVYLPPFHAALGEGAGSVMSAFNELSGVPASANRFTLRQVLREEWGFEGVVLSDYNALAELIAHGFVADLADAARESVLAGVDMDMMGHAFEVYLAALVRAGTVPTEVVDEAVRRILCLKVALGLFERPYADPGHESAVLGRENHAAIALEVARRSIVLLRNEGGLLPLRADRIALLGPLADERQALLGCWHCAGQQDDVESLAAGMRAVRPSCEIELVRGCTIADDSLDEIADAVDAARRAEVAVLALGESDRMSGEARCRAHLGLPGAQRRLLEAVLATGTPTVCVLMTGRPLVLAPFADRVPAIVQAWHGGIRGGRAIAEVLFGQVNPSGRLAISFPRAVGQIPVYYAHKNTGRPFQGEGTLQFEQAFRSNYIDESNRPLYPFGYGLSYTTFEYTDLVVETPEVARADTLVVRATVTNTGDRAGDQVVQLYVRDLVGSVTRPVRELKAFQRVSLGPGEGAEVRFCVPVDQLGFHGRDCAYQVEPGLFEVWVAPHAEGGLKGTFRVVG